MNQHRNGISGAEAMATALGRHNVEVVVVVAGDGEVPHPPLVDLRNTAAISSGGRAVRSFESIALFETLCRDPLVQ
jgi:hypothetical protein